MNENEEKIIKKYGENARNALEIIKKMELKQEESSKEDEGEER